MLSFNVHRKQSKHVTFRKRAFVSFTWFLVGSITTTVAAVTADIPTKVGRKFDFLMDIKCVSGLGMH